MVVCTKGVTIVVVFYSFLLEQHSLSTLATTVMPTVMPLIPASPRGRVITPSLYDVNVTELSASRNRWARSLATTFVRSELDSASKHFLAESAAATQGARARLVLSGRLLLYDLAQSWLGQSAHIHTSTPYWTQSLHPRILPARNAHDESCNIFLFFVAPQVGVAPTRLPRLWDVRSTSSPKHSCASSSLRWKPSRPRPRAFSTLEPALVASPQSSQRR